MRTWAVAAALVLVGGCNLDDELEVSMAVAPQSLRMRVGSQTEARASYTIEGVYHEAVDALRWTSTDPAVVEVDSCCGGIGPLTALAPGQVTVTAESESYPGEQASLEVTVSSTPLTTIDITPPDPTTMVDGHVQLDAIATWGDGMSEPVTRVAVWSSDDEAVVTVFEGEVVGHAPGVATVSAALAGATGQTTVTVTD